MNDILIQQGVGPYRPHLELGRYRHFAWAEKVSWQYEPLTFALGRQYSTFEKFTVPLSFMTGSGRWIGMIDADSLIIGSEDPRPSLYGCDFAAVKNVYGEFNLGTYFILDTEEMRALLLRCVDDLPDEISRQGATAIEQQLLNQNLNAAHGRIKTKELNRRWNDYPMAAGKAEGPIQIKGFHNLATPPDQKLQNMKHYIDLEPR